MLKKCTQCNVKKLLSEFYKDNRAKDGLYSCCKICHVKYEIEKRKNDPNYRINYREKNKEYFRKYHKEWRKKNKKYMKEYDREYYQNNTEKYKKYKKEYCYPHRIIIENIIGRELNRSEVIHHINGNNKDNRIENLQIMSNGEHVKYHMKEYWKLTENRMRRLKKRLQGKKNKKLAG